MRPAAAFLNCVCVCVYAYIKYTVIEVDISIIYIFYVRSADQPIVPVVALRHKKDGRSCRSHRPPSTAFLNFSFPLRTLHQILYFFTLHIDAVLVHLGRFVCIRMN